MRYLIVAALLLLAGVTHAQQQQVFQLVLANGQTATCVVTYANGGKSYVIYCQ